MTWSRKERRGEQSRVCRAVTELMDTLDRSDPIDDATFATIETMLSLLRATPARTSSISERVELLREANRTARAAVVTTGYALISLSDVNRMASRAKETVGNDATERKEP